MAVARVSRTLAPLVAPGPELTAAQAARYARHVVLPNFGELAQRRLLAARVAVVGAGGLGSPVLLALAAAGVGTLGIIDDDTVALSNLQRQVLHTEADVGAPKVDSAARTLRERNSAITVRTHPVRLTPGNALDLLRDYDLVVDGSDGFATKYLVADAAELLGIPCVWGSILRDDGRATTFWATPNDGGPGRSLRDLFPSQPSEDTALSCAAGGVLGPLCQVIGAVLATEVVGLITGRGESLLGRLLSFDALRLGWRESAYLPDPDRVPVTALTPAIAAPERWSAAELARRVREPEAVTVVDVREPFERRLAPIPGALIADIPALLFDATGLPSDRPVVLVCHFGVRAATLAHLLRAKGHGNVVALEGGIDAWSCEIDAAVPRY